MAFSFVVLASGSSGNSAFVGTSNSGVLIDAGLGPRTLEDRMGHVELTWQSVQAVMLTHTHADHWNDRTFAVMREKRIPLYCHPQHHQTLYAASPGFADLVKNHLVYGYKIGHAVHLSSSLSCTAIEVRHDAGVTCGFRVEGPQDMYGERPALAYASDLGTWDESIAKKFANTEILALEFNHDVELQRNSRRPRRTIQRNLGNYGHLSNEQAAALVERILAYSDPGRLRFLVQLHLSRQCNRRTLATSSVEKLLDSAGGRVQLVTASQDIPTTVMKVTLDEPLSRQSGRKRSDTRASTAPKQRTVQPLLPGWE